MDRPSADVVRENVRLSRLEAPFYEANHFEIFHPYEQERLRRHLARYGAVRRVLDVGAGTGNAIGKVVAPTRVAVDLSREMLGRLRDREPSVAAVGGVAEALPFRDGAFDLVVTYSVLHHLADWSPLAEMRRVVRPGGIVLLEHEEAFQEAGWRGHLYGVLRALLVRVAEGWYWRRPEARRYDAYREVWWPYSGSRLGSIDFALTDGAHPHPGEIEAELHRLGMSTRRHHYLLLPLPMSSRWQRLADAACARLGIGHFSVEATR
jgi:SAM-dependent methyltransferase